MTASFALARFLLTLESAIRSDGVSTRIIRPLTRFTSWSLSPAAEVSAIVPVFEIDSVAAIDKGAVSDYIIFRT